jgi:hypothetical protein
MDYDLTFVSGARPDLMKKTLESFQEKLFSNIPIANAYFNIDKIFGGDDEVAACRELAKHYFPNAKIFMPQRPSFGAAVKRLWESTGDNTVLHLEDDWQINFSVNSKSVLEKFDDDVGMVQLAIENRSTYGGDFLYITKRRRILGHEIYAKQVNAYGTSPRFFRAGLCQKFGQLLKPALDPEKQVYKNKNRKLSKAHSPWKCAVLYGKNGSPLITDLGREWRDARKIKKVDHHGRATWVIEHDH